MFYANAARHAVTAKRDYKRAKDQQDQRLAMESYMDFQFCIFSLTCTEKRIAEEATEAFVAALPSRRFGYLFTRNYH